MHCQYVCLTRLTIHLLFHNQSGVREVTGKPHAIVSQFFCPQTREGSFVNVRRASLVKRDKYVSHSRSQRCHPYSLIHKKQFHWGHKAAQNPWYLLQEEYTFLQSHQCVV